MKKTNIKAKVMSFLMAFSVIVLFAMSFAMVSDIGGGVGTVSAGTTPAENISEALETIWVVIPIIIVLAVIGAIVNYMKKM